MPVTPWTGMTSVINNFFGSRGAFNEMEAGRHFIGFHTFRRSHPSGNSDTVKSPAVRRLLTLAVFALFASSIRAQPATSSLYGRVTSAGKPVPSVTITVASPALLGVRTTTSGAGGDYFLRALPPGIWDVEFSHAGMQTVLRRIRLLVADTGRLGNALIDGVAEKNSVDDRDAGRAGKPRRQRETFVNRSADRQPVDGGCVDVRQQLRRL